MDAMSFEIPWKVIIFILTVQIWFLWICGCILRCLVWFTVLERFINSFVKFSISFSVVTTFSESSVKVSNWLFRNWITVFILCCLMILYPLLWVFVQSFWNILWIEFHPAHFQACMLGCYFESVHFDGMCFLEFWICRQNSANDCSLHSWKKVGNHFLSSFVKPYKSF